MSSPNPFAARDLTSSIRPIVERLLAGGRDASDLRQLLVFLRQRSFGHKIVEELGHFVSHQHERDRGITWRRAVDFHRFALFIFRLRLPVFKDEPKPTLEEMREALPAGLRLIGPARAPKLFGVGFGTAKKALASALPKVGTIYPRLGLRIPPTPVERKVLAVLIAGIRNHPVFTGEMATDEIARALLKNKLLKMDEIARWKDLEDYISAFIVCLMQGAVIAGPDGPIGQFRTYVGTSDGQRSVTVGGTLSFMTSKGQQALMAGAVFGTSMPVEEWCDARLLDSPDHPYVSWDGAVEQDATGRIRPRGPLTLRDVIVPGALRPEPPQQWQID